MTEPRDLGLHLPSPGVTNIYYLTGLFHMGSGEGTWVLVLACKQFTDWAVSTVPSSHFFCSERQYIPRIEVCGPWLGRGIILLTIVIIFLFIYINT